MRLTTTLATLLMAATAFAVPNGIIDRTVAYTPVFFSDFEENTPSVGLFAFEKTPEGYQSGNALVATADAGDPLPSITIPFVSDGQSRFEIRCMVKASTPGMRGAIVGRTEKGENFHLRGLRLWGTEWQEARGDWTPETAGPGEFVIYGPNTEYGKPGSLCVDNIEITSIPVRPFDQPFYEDEPACATDTTGTFWSATVARTFPNKRAIHVYRVDTAQREAVAELTDPSWTGIGAPAIAGTDDGCFVAFAVEKDDVWIVAYVFIDRGEEVPALRYMSMGGSSNMAPAVAANGDFVYLAWEANVEGGHVIYGCTPDRMRLGDPQRLSPPREISCNPSVAVTSDNRVFVAWDSIRQSAANIYGCWVTPGEKPEERRLTSDPRIERFANLTARDKNVWMAWEAYSFVNRQPNKYTEQRIAVARIDDDGLAAPKDVMQDIPTDIVYLKRPTIAFDDKERLWLLARRSMGTHNGWKVFARCYSGATWSDAIEVWTDHGRWQPTPMALGKDGLVASVQRDSIWNIGKLGKAHEGWSDVIYVKVPVKDAPPANTLQLEPLTMPGTTFRLAEYQYDTATDLTVPSRILDGRKYQLFWGDMHEHTAVSICARSVNPPPHDLLQNQRDIDKLDFTAITDHGSDITRPQWAMLCEENRRMQDPDDFLLFQAQEWTSDQVPYDPPRPYKGYGHRNIVFLDPYETRHLNSREGDISPQDVWNELMGVEYIMLPHQIADTGNCPTNWEYTNEYFQPLVEIWQTRESYEYLGCPRQAPAALKEKGHYLQDAWADGVIIGVSASPDHGGGRGKTGVWAEQMTRESLFEAMRARHTYGTSGTKMGLFVTSGDNMMGDKITRTNDAPIPIKVLALAKRPIKEVVIWRNNEVVYRDEPHAGYLEFEWVDENPPDADIVWYYVRIHCTDDELAWSSPIWFLKENAVTR